MTQRKDFVINILYLCSKLTLLNFSMIHHTNNKCISVVYGNRPIDLKVSMVMLMLNLIYMTMSLILSLLHKKVFMWCFLIGYPLMSRYEFVRFLRACIDEKLSGLMEDEMERNSLGPTDSTVDQDVICKIARQITESNEWVLLGVWNTCPTKDVQRTPVNLIGLVQEKIS